MPAEEATIDPMRRFAPCPTRWAFEDAAMPHIAALYNFARWMTRNPHDAEDLVQETYLKAFRAFASLRAGSNVRAWMFQILKNTHFTHYARLERRMIVQLGEDEDLADFAISHDTPESLLESSLDCTLIRSLIDRLPSQFREVLLLRDVEEMSYQQIAEILSVPIGTVMSRLSRARKLMRHWLSDRPS